MCGQSASVTRQLPAPIRHSGPTVTIAEVYVIVARDIVKYEVTKRVSIKVPLADHQFDALGALCDNIGQSGFSCSAFVTHINGGERLARIRAAILMWCKAAEILYHRTAEADQFATRYTTRCPGPDRPTPGQSA
ncbi:hypothetical protein KHC28_27115 [Ancylobacter sonchi]|uniref:glycoside hydrolase family protein n=1 Tax=Ancylobacter sonchi TaxID=1937790 RepID=UPI001BD60DD5|nr:hypothetical protein [Ancylobacter sonchi]MBS7537326.1 hypothetical protein [Ancylobacter sonchi]